MAGLKLDGAGQAKMASLDEAQVIFSRANSAVENYALAVKRNQPTGAYMTNYKRQMPALASKLKGQFGMISDQVAALNLVVTRGANEQTRIRVLREGIGSIRQALEIAAQRVKENHAEKDGGDAE